MCNCVQMFPHVFSQQTHVTPKEMQKSPTTLCNVKVKQMQPEARQKLLVQHSKVHSFGQCADPPTCFLILAENLAYMG